MSKTLPDRRREWLLAEKRVDGHLAHQQHDPRLEQRELALQERSAQRDLGARRWSVAVARGRLAREAARERRQVDVLAEIARRKARAVEPVLEEPPSRSGEVVPLAIGHRPGAWPISSMRGSSMMPGRIGLAARKQARSLARPTRQHLGRPALSSSDLTLVGKLSAVCSIQLRRGFVAERMTHRWRSATAPARPPRSVVAAAHRAACGVHPQTAFNPRSEYATRGPRSLFDLIIYMGVVIGVLVEAVLIWAAIRYRRRAGRSAAAADPRQHASSRFSGRPGPVLVVGCILFVTLPVIFATQAPAPTGSMNVNVIGHQFWWEFQYPDAERRHRQRAASAGRAHREPDAAVGRRDPLVLGARAGRQARRVPGATPTTSG